MENIAGWGESPENLQHQDVCHGHDQRQNSGIDGEHVCRLDHKIHRDVIGCHPK